MEKTKDKQIAISPSLFPEFERMAKSYDLTNKGLLEAMVLYFKATKADPRDPKADNPTDAIKALDKRIISFIKEQEKKLLKPMLDEMRVVGKQLEGVQDMQKDSLIQLRQSQIRVIGGAIKPDLLNEKFVDVYKNLQGKP
jgi:hypothetical protein